MLGEITGGVSRDEKNTSGVAKCNERTMLE